MDLCAEVVFFVIDNALAETSTLHSVLISLLGGDNGFERPPFTRKGEKSFENSVVFGLVLIMVMELGEVICDNKGNVCLLQCQELIGPG